MRPDGGWVRPHDANVGAARRLVDAICIFAAHLAAVLLNPRDSWGVAHWATTVVAIVAFQITARDLYQPWRGAPAFKEVGQVFVGWLPVVPIVLAGAFVLKESATLSRFTILTWFVAAPITVAVARLGMRVALHAARRRGLNVRYAAILGSTELGESIARQIANTPELGLRVIGFYDDRVPGRRHDVPKELGEVKGTFEELVTEARNGRIDIVYLALPLRAEPRVNALLRKLADTTATVYLVPDFFVFDMLYGRWHSLGDLPVLGIFGTPFYGVDGVLKRIEDIILGSIFLSIAAVPMMLIALGIKLTSRGPVFFRQRRYGLNGEVIDVLKFRSMRVMENGAAVKQATKNDDRITPFGKFLRRTSLDELPQLIHVVQGTMSLVGPRPHAVAHNEEYRKRIHGYMLRHKVKPGLTGWAQVNGWRGETDTLEKMEKRVDHDLEYIRRWGIWFDIKIVFMTIFGRAAHKNAY